MNILGYAGVALKPSWDIYFAFYVAEYLDVISLS